MSIFVRLKNKLVSLPFFSDHYCCICRSKIGRFLPYKGGLNVVPSFFKVLDMVGSDVDNFSCPRCWSHDRERHLFLYFEKMGMLPKFHHSHILHFAPERWIAKIIAEKQPARYIKADLYPAAPDIVKVDMLNIQYPNDSFDFVIANHVLEHVHDEMQALKELHRVLKPGGFAILQTPYSAKLLHTFCDAGIDDDESRLQAYGQEDHVRLYGRDIFERFESVGFISRVKTHSEILAGIDAKKYGLNQSEPFFLYEKA
jgi:predicted SAM-dependent methyltransferase